MCKKANEKVLYHCRGYLFCNYKLLEKSINQIAKECRVVYSTIRYWLKKFDIRRRTLSESLIGNKNPNYGKHWTWSKESKENISGKNNPNWGKEGYWSGKQRTEETKKKISVSMEGKMYGEKSPTWKGDNITVKALHIRIRKIKPKPADGKCEICHKVADKKDITVLELSNIKDHQYTSNPDDYQYAHHSCHLEYDAPKKWTTKKRKEQSERMKRYYTNKSIKTRENQGGLEKWLK